MIGTQAVKTFLSRHAVRILVSSFMFLCLLRIFFAPLIPAQYYLSERKFNTLIDLLKQDNSLPRKRIVQGARLAIRNIRSRLSSMIHDLTQSIYVEVCACFFLFFLLWVFCMCCCFIFFLVFAPSLVAFAAVLTNLAL